MKRTSDLNNYKTERKKGDYPVQCDMCGFDSWYSQTKIQHKYTGKGGTLACKNCQDKITHSLIPFVIKPEKSVPLAKYQSTTPTAAQRIDFTKSPPEVFTGMKWKQLDTVTWATWLTNWNVVI